MEVSQCPESEHNPDAISSEANVHLEVCSIPIPTVMGNLSIDEDYGDDQDFAKRPSIIVEETEEDVVPTSPSPLMEEHRIGFKFDADVVAKQIMKEAHAQLKAKVVSVICIIISLVVGVRMIMAGISGGALAVFGFAGEALLDVMVSVLVIWRHRKVDLSESSDAEEALLELRKHDLDREHRFTLLIGASFFAFAVVLFMAGLVHLLHEWADADKEHQASRDAMIVAWPAFVVYVVLFFFKVRLANTLDSRTLRQAAVCTMFDAIIALLIGLASSLELFLATEEDDDMDAYTVIDPITTFVIAAFICGQGLLMVSSNAVAYQHHIELA